ncbi:hypothetical protein B0H14DRAFT_3586076 [Mycena olivaceomarginata]|nr:hypothetical protein B0H14DRAFT_3586076 [Mycena olivaceomarginata]
MHQLLENSKDGIASPSVYPCSIQHTFNLLAGGVYAHALQNQDLALPAHRHPRRHHCGQTQPRDLGQARGILVILQVQYRGTLQEISNTDLAEQTLSTLEKNSEEFPSSIVREGGLSALLNYLDFFSIAVQRTALQAASNCCRNIRGVWPIIRNCLAYSDQRLVEFACLCVIRVVDAYHRASVENLEALVDTELIRAVNGLLLPAGAPLLAANTYTLLVRALATAVRASPKITLALLEADIVDTLYQILTGVLPPAGDVAAEQGGASGGAGLGGGLADMTVMENLAHRPKDQVEETLSLVSELMPPLPKDGVFDHKDYTENSPARMVKAKAKAERAAARQATHASLAAAMLVVDSLAPTPKASSSAAAAAPADDSASGETAVAEPEEGTASALPAPDRLELLRSKPAVVGWFMGLMVLILIDVYAASVITPVRVKTLTGLLKAVSFLDADGLKRVLTFVPVASFASSILSSKDHPTLVIGALQLVDLLLAKVPALYKPTFRREGPPAKDKEPAATAASSSSSSAKDKEKEKEEGDVGVRPRHPMPTLIPQTPRHPRHCSRRRAAAAYRRSQASSGGRERVWTMEKKGECTARGPGSGQRADTPGTHPCLAAALADDAVCNLHTSIFTNHAPLYLLPHFPPLQARLRARPPMWVQCALVIHHPPRFGCAPHPPHLDTIDTHLLIAHVTPRPAAWALLAVAAAIFHGQR